MSRASVQIVNAGIDTLKVNVKRMSDDGVILPEQELPMELGLLFQSWQDCAKENGEPVKTTMTFEGARLMAYPNGAASWRYVFRNDCIELKAGPRLNVPMVAKVTFLSEYLWRVGPLQAVTAVDVFLGEVFGQALLQAAQIDLCADVVGLHLPREWEQVFVTRAVKKRSIKQNQKDQDVYRGRALETVMFSGHGRPVSCKMYDKVAEIIAQAKKKEWFYPLWRKNGWDGKAAVWRVEFSIERECLREMELEGVYETLNNIKRLWAYCTEDWLRMVRPGETKKRTRWETHTTWIRIQQAFQQLGDPSLDGLGQLVREQRRKVNIDRGVAAIAGYATTLAAWCEQELSEDADADTIFTMIYDKVIERWNKLEVTPQDLVREKKFLYHLKS